MTTPAPPAAGPTAGPDTFGRRVIARLLDLLPIALLFVVTYLPSLDQLGATDGCPTVPAPDCNIIDIQTGTDANGEPAPVYIMENGRELAADHQTIDLGGTTYIADPPPTASYLLPLAYVLVVFVVLQGMVGWTPGKLVTGLRLAQEDGRAAGTTKAFLRWAVPDGLIGVVGVIFGLAGGPWPLAALSLFAALPLFRWLASYVASPVAGVNDAGLGLAVVGTERFRGHAEADTADAQPGAVEPGAVGPGAPPTGVVPDDGRPNHLPRSPSRRRRSQPSP
jgi:hypothetical protein